MGLTSLAPRLRLRNCNTFSNALLLRICGRGSPPYVNRLASIGSFFSCLLPKSMLPDDPISSGSGPQGGGGWGSGWARSPSGGEDGGAGPARAVAGGVTAPRANVVPFTGPSPLIAAFGRLGSASHACGPLLPPVGPPQVEGSPSQAPHGEGTLKSAPRMRTRRPGRRCQGHRASAMRFCKRH